LCFTSISEFDFMTDWSQNKKSASLSTIYYHSNTFHGGAFIKYVRSSKTYGSIRGVGAKAYVRIGAWTDYYLAVDFSFVILNTTICLS